MSVSDKIVDLRHHREAIRTAIVAKGGILPLGSHMSDYPGVIETLSGGGEVDFSSFNGIVKGLEVKDGVVNLKELGRNVLVLPEVPHKIGNSFLLNNTSITTLANTEYTTEIETTAFRYSAITGDLSFPNVTTLVSLGTAHGYYFGDTKITSADLPLVESLPNSTFSSCSQLKRINIPNVKTIHHNAFGFARNIGTITLGETIPVIGGGTSFYYFLTDTYAPNCQFQVPPHMVDAYKADTFWSQYADNIVPAPDPESIPPKPTEAVDGVITLPNIPHKIENDYLNSNTSVTTLLNTEYTTEIGQGAFYKSVITGNYHFPNVTTIGGSVFYECKKITEISLPLIKYLPYGSFNDSSLKKITIPSVEKIYHDAFKFNSEVETIILGETIPIFEGGTSFYFFLSGSFSTNCQVQVPPHMVDAYKADTFWSQYADNIVPYPEEE